MGCQCMECAPQRVMAAPAKPVAPPAPSIESKPAANPSLGLAAQESATESGTGSTGQSTEEAPAASGGAGEPKELTQEEKAQIAKLQARDREVRAHEQAHAAVGGGLAGAPSYTYQQGPDGKQYAVGGEVSIKASTGGGSPRAAIQQLQQMARAALAPANPSGQDRAVAAAAQQQIAQLQAQLAQESRAKAQEALQSSTGGNAASNETRPGEAEPLLPELPGLSAAAGRDDTSTAPQKPATVIEPLAPPQARPSTLSGASDETVRPPTAAYQQASAKPNVAGRIFSLNA